MTEFDIQTQVLYWAGTRSVTCPELALLFHVPNEGKRSPVMGSMLKRAGLKSGVPDLILPVARRYNEEDLHGLFIELKNGNKKPTLNQVWWLEHLADQGYYACVCTSADAAIYILAEYLGIDPGVAIRSFDKTQVFRYGGRK